MFRQTQGGAVRNWFDDLDPKSVNSFEELSQKFLEEFSQQKRYAKDPTEIHGIKRRQNEGLQAFMDRFKSDSSHIKGVPPVLRISAFMHGHGHPELAKKLNDKIPKMVDEMFERVRAFIRGELVAGSAEMSHPTQCDKGNTRLVWSGGQDKARNKNRPREHIEEVVALGKLAHLLKDIHRSNQRNGSQGRNGVKVINMMNDGRNYKRSYEREGSGLTEELTFPAIPQNSLMNEPIILEGMIEGHQGIVTMETSKEALWECRQLEKTQDSWKETQWRQHMEQMSRIREQTILRGRNNPGLRPDKEPMLPEKERGKGLGGTAVLRFVMEHQLKAYPLAELVVHKISPLTPYRRQALKEKVFNWLKEGTIRKVQHPEWITNATLIKLANGAWQVQVDYSSLNRVCAKDIMVEDDKEKTGFHTEEGVYCFTHMPKGLKNSAATLQRMVEKVLADQKVQNVELYLEEIAVKSKDEQSLIEDVEETLNKLKWVNMKINLNESTLEIKEGRFLDYTITENGIRPDPAKVQAIMKSHTPRGSDQIRHLSLQLASIGMFIPKLAELMLPIRKVRQNLDMAEGPN
ncbi:reverse transcriptase domain-containing protein [Tanacetum coccineum]